MCFSFLRAFSYREESRKFQSIPGDGVQTIFIKLFLPQWPCRELLLPLVVRVVPNASLKYVPFLFCIKNCPTSPTSPPQKLIPNYGYSDCLLKEEKKIFHIYSFILSFRNFIWSIYLWDDFPSQCHIRHKATSGLFLLVHWTAVLPEKKEKIMYQSKTSGETICSLIGK